MTTQQVHWTPYDDEIAKWRGALGAGRARRADGTFIKIQDYLDACRRREGYLRAKAEAAPLLAAAQALLAYIDAPGFSTLEVDERAKHPLRVAIGQYEGEQP